MKNNLNSIGIDKKTKDTVVVVAMSGGVDSSTVAGLMKKEGYKVIGITLKLYDDTKQVSQSKQCCAGQDILDAKRVAHKLDIDHKILYYQNKFKEGVIDNFVESYLKGETPIPCVQCNQTVKFKDLFMEAKDLKADALITGHYVRSIFDGKKNEMYRAEDHNRDQSYFLFNTKRDQLDYLRFPLGNLLKDKKKIVLDLIGTFQTASKLSLSLRKKGLKETIKEDNTPVTNGDLEVNNLLIDKISKLTPDILIISEESSSNKNLDNLSTFWLIDPIDGTYDYINDKDEFTLNAALIINKVPEIGIISAPAKNRLFYTYGDGNSFEIINDKAQLLNTKIITSDKENIKAVSYSDKLKNEIKDIHDKFKVTSYTKMKSSLKFCVIAAGEFDLYVAEPRASEWDIAAGDAILSNSGGSITDMNGEKIYYGKKDFKNPGIILKSARLNNG